MTTAAIAVTLSAALAFVAPPPAGAPATGAPAAPPDASKSMPKLRLQRVAPQVPLRRPVQVVFAPGDDRHMFVLEQPGRILVLDPEDREAKEAAVFMDIHAQVNSRGNEEGLLSMAFHPDFAHNHSFFLFYTRIEEGGRRQDVLSRWTMDPETQKGDPKSEQVLLAVDDPYSNHNGGTALFGKDGMLYLSIGDGGAANDPKHSGQDLGTLLAKVLRIDVDHPSDGLPYGIPKDNPFVATPGARGEVWAYGLRNAWRMSFDRKTGDLWAGDVGQNLYEEVDLVTRGGNYGWNVREALHPFAEGTPGNFGHDYVDPVVEYPHSQGVSITGGYVSRSAKEPRLDGIYLYADLVSCRVWGIRAPGGKLEAGPEVLFTTKNQLPTSFGEANDGTLYLVTFEGSQDPRAKGGVWRISTVE